MPFCLDLQVLLHLGWLHWQPLVAEAQPRRIMQLLVHHLCNQQTNSAFGGICTTPGCMLLEAEKSTYRMQCKPGLWRLWPMNKAFVICPDCNCIALMCSLAMTMAGKLALAKWRVAQILCAGSAAVPETRLHASSLSYVQAVACSIANFTRQPLQPSWRTCLRNTDH